MTILSSNTYNVLDMIKVCVLVLTACGCFLVGINLMTKGTVTICTNKNSFFSKLFRKNNRFASILGGLLHSAATQSSDSTSVFVIRLSDAGAITLFSACCAMIGANIGTTITNFIASMSALNIAPYFAFAAFIGAIPLLIGKGKAKTFGEIVSGFGVMFIGLQLLELYFKDEMLVSAISSLFEICSNPYLMLALGFVLTSIIQSSSAVTSLVIFLVGGGVLSLTGAFYAVVGANIGTCVTGLIASAKSSLNGKRASLFHLTFNIIGASLFLTIMAIWNTQIMTFAEAVRVPPQLKVAVFSLIFNFAAAIIYLPIVKPMVLLTKKIIRAKA